MKNKVVFFDFFGVICSEIAPIWLEKHFDRETASQIKESIFTRADIGEIDEEETFEELSKVTCVSVLTIKSEWSQMISVNSGIVELIRSLKANHRVYLLSNAISSFLNRILDSNDLVKLFDKIYISSDIKIIKPNKEFFEYVLNDLNISPADAVMIDDNPKNIEGAILAGVNGIVFKSRDELIKELRKQGYLFNT